MIGLFASQPQPVLVAAASDLAPLQAELTAGILRATGVPVRFTFAGSGILARQIENGAPYDVYLSANEQFVRDLEKRGKVTPGSATVYAYGFLGLWSKSGKVHQVRELTGTVALPNPVHAPYGAAARELLKALGLWAKLQPKIVYGENVMQTFQFAETGNADACITSWSIVRDRGGVLLNVADYAPIRQTGAVVGGSKRRADAVKVLRFLQSPAGKKILKDGGLGTP